MARTKDSVKSVKENTKVKDIDRCTHCEACKHCQMIEVGHKIVEAVERFIDTKSRSSDVVFCDHLLLAECRKTQPLIHQFRTALKAVGVDF